MKIKKKRAVLLVDDDKLVLFLLASSLSRYNIQIITSNSAAEALKILSSDDIAKICLVITDYKMPIMNGVIFAKQVKKNLSFANLPIILMTQFPDQFLKDEYTSSLFHKILMKPVAIKTFISMVVDLCSTPML